MSSIIKASTDLPQPSGQNVRHVAFSFSDMGEQAQVYLDEVRSRAAAIIADAKQQAEVVRRRAEEEGRQAALRAVEKILEEKVARQMETLLPALRSAVEQIEDARQAWVNHWHASVVKLACSIAEKIVRRKLDQVPEITLDLVAEALQLATGTAEVTLRMNPQDVQSLGQQVGRLTQELHALSPVQIVADQDISPGGCRLETRFGSIDQRIESQLKRIEEELS